MINSISSGNYYMSQMSNILSRTMSSSASDQTDQLKMGKGPNPSEMFDKVDLDGSGGLSLEEFQTLADKISEAAGKEINAEDIFNSYDEDGDGVLSESETQAVMEDNRPEGPPPGGMGGMQGMGPDISELINNVDENEDGNIDETEFESLAEMISKATGEDVVAEELFAAYDADGNGVLSTDETEKLLEDNRPEGPPPPPEGMTPDSETSSFAWSNAISSYSNIMMMMGTEQSQIQYTDQA